MGKGIKSGIKIFLIVIIAILGVVVIVTLSPVLLMILVMVVFGDHRPTPTDSKMIAHFESNEVVFERLRQMFACDSMEHIPLFYDEKRDGEVLPISAEREHEYDSLMKEIQVTRISDRHFFPGTKNMIVFDYFSKGDATWGIEKGYEYISNRAEEKDKRFIFTKEESDDIARKEEHVFFCKKINDHWNIFAFYDR